MAKRPIYTKQQAERIIFNAVYDAREFAAVDHLDRPDFFVFPHGSHQSAFGVEITEVYEDESNARLQNIQGYFEDLLAGKPHRHRDDVETLKVETVELISKEGVVREPITVIMQEVTDRPNLPALVAERIRAKVAQATGYSHDLTHTNLVILDRTSRLVSSPPVDEAFAVQTFLSPDLRTVLSGSGFHEVHLVVRDKNGMEVVRGLRALTMVEAANVFLEAVRTVVGLPFDCSDQDGHLLFILACERQGLQLDYVSGKRGVLAQFGGVQVQFAESGIRILDAHQIRPDPPSDRPLLGIDSDIAERIIHEYIGFTTSHEFSCAWGAPAKLSFAWSRADLGISIPEQPEE
ncbi:hypothetical protein P3H80_18915 [Mycolicibacterium septicum]|uniref:hypothetical protein n=1 Tax=Mycolicibacterium septicum TaxID=98668 RepID=UPI0023E0C4ED|nr:hypothetical protein [Mycolicibacterium septicum]MDF3339516.1 hypothetical protein [Mycolicibacterium septicum]